VCVDHSLREYDDLDKGNETEDQQRTGHITPETIIYLLGILQTRQGNKISTTHADLLICAKYDSCVCTLRTTTVQNTTMITVLASTPAYDLVLFI